MFELDAYEKFIVLARRAPSHIEAIKRNTYASGKMGYPYDTRENEEGKTKYPHVKFLPIIPTKTLTLLLQIPIINSLNPGLRAMFVLPRNLSWSNTYPTLT
jgi:hypothetical protein